MSARTSSDGGRELPEPSATSAVSQDEGCAPALDPGIPDPLACIPGTVVLVSLARQRLVLYRDGVPVAEYPVSTARNGPGKRIGSGCTPRGWHQVRARIGAGAPVNTVFVRRRPTGETYGPDLACKSPDRDWILTRILWLSGLEPGHNRLGEVDTFRRFIYIHGTPDVTPLGLPASHGCVRMANADVVALFDQVPAGTRVLIQE